MPDPIVSQEADRDVDAQADDDRDRGSPETATRWVERTRSTFAFLMANPGIGEEVRPGLRAWRVERFKQHVVIDHATPDRIEIVRVINGASDLDRLL